MVIAVFFERYGWSIAAVLVAVAVGDAVVPVAAAAAAAAAADDDHDEYSFLHWDDQMYDNRDM